MSAITLKIDKYFYPGYENYWDIFLFKNRINQFLKPDSIVLDIGAGAGIVPLNFKGRALQICGVDPDQRVMQNPYLDEAKTGYAESIPYGDETFDIVLCTHLVEHLAKPQEAFREIHRVLKKNGLFFIKTVNKHHYVSLLARITPLSFHKFYNSTRGRKTEDTFKTYYRANSENQIRKYAETAGFRIDKIELIEGRPEYLRIAWPCYLLGTGYERIVNCSGLMRHFRAVIFACLRKA